MFISKNISTIYDVICTLGIGTYGEVLKVIDKKKSKNYAIKISYMDENSIINPIILRETSNLCKLKHNNITKLHKVFISKYNNKNCVCMVLGLCEGTFLDVSDYTDINFFFQIIDALIYMYQNGFYHGDLSLNNILLKQNEVILADLGFSRKYYRKFDDDLKPSLQARPIEFLLEEFYNINAKKIDIWGLGCLLYSIFKKEHIVADFSDDLCLYEEVKKKYILAIQKIQDDELIPNNFKKIFKTLLNFNPNKRISYEKIKHLDFFNNQTFKEIYSAELEKYNTNLVNNNIYKSIDVNKMLNLLLFINKFTINNEIEDETLFLTLHNSKRIKLSYSLKNSSGNNLILIFIILFWLSNKIISIKIMSKKEIILLLNAFGCHNYDFDTTHNIICYSLKWNIDQHTMYSYINYIPTILQPYYKLLMLIIEIFDIAADKVYYWFFTIYNIFKQSLGYDCEVIDKMINYYVEKGQVTTLLIKQNTIKIKNIIYDILYNQELDDINKFLKLYTKDSKISFTMDWLQIIANDSIDDDSY